MYADLALQYTVFRREIAKAADTLAEEEGVPFQPLIVQDIKPVEQKKFNLNDCVYRKVTPVRFRTINNDGYGVPYISDHFPILFTSEF